MREAGYEYAALGFSLSYNTSVERAKEILPRYAFGKAGERNFLESIYLWIDITAPRFWWSEADRYRLSTKQSESTLHTLTKNLLTNKNFEYPLEQHELDKLNKMIVLTRDGMMSISELKGNLPDGFLQRRIWVMNYKCMQNIIEQREGHRLIEWGIFCDTIMKEIEHPEFIKR